MKKYKIEKVIKIIDYVEDLSEDAAAGYFESVLDSYIGDLEEDFSEVKEISIKTSEVKE